MAPTPLCPRSFTVAWDPDIATKTIIEGSACIGSRCAAWQSRGLHPGDVRYGACGLASGSIGFPDPATQPSTPSDEAKR